MSSFALTSQYRGISTSQQQRHDPLLAYLKTNPSSKLGVLNEPLDPQVLAYNASRISEYDPYAVNRKFDRTLRTQNQQVFSISTHVDEVENQTFHDISYQGLIISNNKDNNNNNNNNIKQKKNQKSSSSLIPPPSSSEELPPPSPGSYADRTGFGKLKYSIVKYSSQACNKEAKYLRILNKKKFWQATGVSTEYIIFKFTDGPSLLSTVDIYNKDCDSVKIYVGEEKSKNKLRLAKTVKFLSKGRMNNIRLGHVPCLYVKIEFMKTVLRPGPTIYSVRFVGMLSETVEQELPSLSNLLVKNTEDLLYHLNDDQDVYNNNSTAKRKKKLIRNNKRMLVGDGSRALIDSIRRF